MKTELTLNVLQTMNAQEYEDIRAAGSDDGSGTAAVCTGSRQPFTGTGGVTGYAGVQR